MIFKRLILFIIMCAVAVEAVNPALAATTDAHEYPGLERFIITDSANDDYGNGQITYPRDNLFPSGSFDLLELVFENRGGMLLITATFRSTIQSPGDIRISELTSLKSICEEGYYAFNLDIYLDVPDLTDPGVTWLLPGRGAELAAGYRWNKAIIFTPRPTQSRKKLIRLLINGIESTSRESLSPKPKSLIREEATDFVDQHILFARNLTIRRSSISVELPLDWLGVTAIKGCRVLPVVTGSAFNDSFDILNRITSPLYPGNLFTRAVTHTGMGKTFGNGSGLPGESWIIDTAVPPGFSQETLLNRFNADHYPRLPMIQLEK